MDFSRAGLAQFPAEEFSNVLLVHGDVCWMPFQGSSFDLAVSSQVLEHIPSPSQRSRFVAELARCLRPGGTLALSVYNWDRAREASDAPKEGFHSKGIYYYCFTSEELRTLLDECFDVRAMLAVEVRLPLTFRLANVLGQKMLHLERAIRGWSFAQRYSNLLLAVAARR
jgi:SAM-dependent methyltransferase